MLFFELSTKQLNFFQRKGCILFEEFLPEKFFEEISKACFQQKVSRNLWLENPTFKKLSSYSSIVSLACSLIKKPYVRIGFDCLLTKKEELYSFAKTSSFSLQNSFQPLSLCVLLNLSSKEISCELIEEGRDNTALLLPSNSVLFFHPEKCNLFFPETEEDPLLYLLAYLEKNSRYVFCEKDPHTHDLKKKGYVFGDLVKDEHHPLLISKISL